MRGPDGTTAVVKVSAKDDASKDSHLCMADYELLLTRASEREPAAVSILYSDGEWDRDLSVYLSGFSHDGKRIFGVLAEGGSGPTQQLFDCDVMHGQVRLVDLQKQLARISGKECRVAADVIGTTEAGVIVIELTSADRCAPSSRWALDPVKGRLQRLSGDTAVLGLYK